MNIERCIEIRSELRKFQQRPYEGSLFIVLHGGINPIDYVPSISEVDITDTSALVVRDDGTPYCTLVGVDTKAVAGNRDLQPWSRP